MNPNINHEIKTWPNMPFERWWSYMMCHLIIYDLKDSHYICKDSDGKSWLKLKK